MPVRSFAAMARAPRGRAHIGLAVTYSSNRARPGHHRFPLRALEYRIKGDDFTAVQDPELNDKRWRILEDEEVIRCEPAYCFHVMELQAAGRVEARQGAGPRDVSRPPEVGSRGVGG